MVSKFETDHAIYWVKPENISAQEEAEVMSKMDAVFCVGDIPQQAFSEFKKRYAQTYEILKKDPGEIWFREGNLLIATKKRWQGTDSALVLFYFLLGAGCIGWGLNDLRNFAENRPLAGISEADVSKMTRRTFLKVLAKVGGGFLVFWYGVIPKQGEWDKGVGKNEAAYVPINISIDDLYSALMVVTLENYAALRFKNAATKSGGKPNIYVVVAELGEKPIAKFFKDPKTAKKLMDTEYRKILDEELVLSLVDDNIPPKSAKARELFDSFYEHKVHRYKLSGKDEWEEQATTVTVID